jgi:hypothetical protein
MRFAPAGRVSLAVCAVLVATLVSPARAQLIERVSIASNGTQANLDSNADPVLTRDGRFVVFSSAATTLAAGCGALTGPSPPKTDVFLRDRLSGITRCLTLAPDGTAGDGHSRLPALDGSEVFTAVAFQSLASNLVPGCAGIVTAQIYVFPVFSPGGECVSRSALGVLGNNSSTEPLVAGQGRLVLFRSTATNLVPDPMMQGSLYLKDRFTGGIDVVDRASDGTVGNAPAAFAAVSRTLGLPTVAFVAFATNLAPNCTAGTPLYLFVRDLASGSTTCLGVVRDLGAGVSFDVRPALSADGRIVAFASAAPDIVPGCGGAARSDVFLHDRATGSTVCVTHAAVPQPIPDRGGASGAVSLSEDARFLAFESYAGGLVPDPANGFAQVFVFDRASGRIAMVSRAVNGTPGNGDSRAPRISADGRVVAFASAAANLVPGDTNGRVDIFAAVVRSPNLAGLYVTTGNLDATGPDEIVTGAGPGTDPYVKMFTAAGVPLPTSFLAYAPAFTGGVRVAACDMDGDSRAEIVTGAGPGGGPHVRVVKLDAGGHPAADQASFFAYSAGFTGGLFVACGDVDGDGVPEIITGADAGGGPHVRVLKLDPAAPGGVMPFVDFLAYGSAFAGGVRVAAGNVDGSDRASLILAPGPGGGPHVRVLKWTGAAFTSLAEFFAYVPAFAGGVFVAAGDVTGGGVSQVITGADAGGGPQVRVFTGTGQDTGLSIFAYFENFTGGVRVAAGNLEGTGADEIVTGAGPGGGPHVRAFQGTGMPVIPLVPTNLSFFAY